MKADREREEASASAYTSVVANSIYGQSVWGRMRMRQLLNLRELARLARTPPDPRLARRRPLYLIAVMLLVAGLLTQYALLLFCGLLLLGIAIVPEVWYRYGLRGVVVRREIESQRAAFGSVTTVALTVENRSLLPLPMVETEDEFPEALTVLGARLGLSTRPGSAWLTRSLRLWAFQRVRRRYYLRAIHRGVYQLGPTVTRVTDPFGILTREETFETTRTLLVHPLIAPLDRFGLTPRAIFGDHASHRRLLEDPLRVAGVRDYAPGDDPRRVHWKATARLGKLQSKLLDPSTQRTLIIALDVRTFNRAQMGYDPELAELGLAVAGSVAAWAVERGFAVGLISNGAFSTLTPEGQAAPARASGVAGALALPRLRLEPAARVEQLTLVLDSLARLVLYGGAPMGPLLIDELRSAPTGATLVYVGLESLVDVGTIAALRRAQQSGHETLLALTTRDENDPFAEEMDKRVLRASSLPTYFVGGRSRWQALVKEAMGELSPRQATDVPSEETLAAERGLIAKQRAARKAWARRREEETHAESGERRDDDTGRAAEPTDAALALS